MRAIWRWICQLIWWRWDAVVVGTTTQLHSSLRMHIWRHQVILVLFRCNVAALSSDDLACAEIPAYDADAGNDMFTSYGASVDCWYVQPTLPTNMLRQPTRNEKEHGHRNRCCRHRTVQQLTNLLGQKTIIVNIKSPYYILLSLSGSNIAFYTLVTNRSHKYNSYLIFVA